MRARVIPRTRGCVDETHMRAGLGLDGVNTIVLRSRLRRDGYDPKTDEVYDLQQAIRIVRAHAAEWHIDPKKIGVMGFSAGAELAMAAAIQYGDFDKKNAGAPRAGV